MNTELDEDRVQELGASAYAMLKQTYSGLTELKQLVDKLHQHCMQTGTLPEFDGVESVVLVLDGIYSELDRYLRPLCDPDSATASSMPEHPES